MVIDLIVVSLIWTDTESHVNIELFAGNKRQGMLCVGVAEPSLFIKAKPLFLKKFIMDMIQDFQAALDAKAISEDREMTLEEERKHHEFGVEIDRVMLLEVDQAKVRTLISRANPEVVGKGVL